LKKILFVSLLAFLSIILKAQNTLDSSFSFSGYIETFFGFDPNQPFNNQRPSFLYSFNRHNEVNLNLGYLEAGYNVENFRAKLALMTGTYAQHNLAHEPGVLRNILEAYVGFRLNQAKNFWLDVGVFDSHIGFEDARGVNCLTLTRSMAAENSPYYLSGVRLAYESDNEKWYLSGLVVNGWQRIRRLDGSRALNFGHQITYNPNNKITLNSSSFIGSDAPDSLNQKRYFHNFFTALNLTEKLTVILGFDIGFEVFKRQDNAVWYTPLGVVSYRVNQKLRVSGRAEQFTDRNNIIIAANDNFTGFSAYGFSLNTDYFIGERFLLRFEGRTFNASNAIFENSSQASTRQYISITSSISVRF
jgi:hypothetical protein